MNLFICFTPLQLTLAKKIIEQNSISKNECYLFYYSYHDNLKEKHHFHRYSSDFDRSFYFNERMSLLFLAKLYVLAKKLKKIDVLYLSSVDNGIVHFFMSYLNFDILNTFDDGTANISKDSVFYIQPKKSFIKNILHILLGKRFDLKSICKKTSQHYTIYPEFENITNKITPLNLLNYTANNINELDSKKSINCFLGSIYHEIVTNSIHVNFLEYRVVETVNSLDAIYFPHPRETVGLNVGHFSSDKRIAEEIVVDYLQQGYHVNVYGFSSSAQFNLLNIPGVTCYVIDSIMLKDAFRKLHCLAVNKGACAFYID
ncbi:glycosyltransferase family 52 protein [Budvicia aquatica]|uniref:glycosyltransferase family 52 protein n=1 Tax=Budvicia aquatica TaxID=82979 RepID=UPI0020839A0F|nr:glycosyltransferase family 52 protein [Budvicia aquatica]GKX51176.1 beta-galactosamide-alpha-2,3-sialyltransferase [Budvicia aquatica]